MKNEFGKVAVLMGGNSAEREISLLTGHAVLAALLRLIALHGRGGEDGTVQGLLEQLGIPYTGSGVLGSALAMDKYRTKQLWQEQGLPTPPDALVSPNSDLTQIVKQLGLPLMVKPVLEGSSVGMAKVSQLDELADAIKTAAQFNCEVIAEHYIKGLEYTAAILFVPVVYLLHKKKHYKPYLCKLFHQSELAAGGASIS